MDTKDIENAGFPEVSLISLKLFANSPVAVSFRNNKEHIFEGFGRLNRLNRSQDSLLPLIFILLLVFKQFNYRRENIVT